MRKMMNLKTKTKKREAKVFVGITSYPLGGGRWGVGPVYETDIVEREVACICWYNVKAVINNALAAIEALLQKEVA